MLSNHMSELNASQSFTPRSPMYLVVAICTKSLKIFNFIVKSIAINVMYDKNLDVINPATIAFNLSMIFYRTSEAIRHIRNLGCKSIVDKGSACTPTKFSFTTLKFGSSCNYLTTQLTWMALNASK